MERPCSAWRGSCLFMMTSLRVRSSEKAISNNTVLVLTPFEAVRYGQGPMIYRMAIMPGLLPPSRETWETACTLFKFFPVVSAQFTAGRCYVVCMTDSCFPLDHCVSMGSGLVSAGQNVDRVSFQYLRQMGMGYDGVRGLHDASLHHVYAPQGARP